MSILKPVKARGEKSGFAKIRYGPKDKNKDKNPMTIKKIAVSNLFWRETFMPNTKATRILIATKPLIHNPPKEGIVFERYVLKF